MIYCTYSNQQAHPFKLPELPFDKEGFGTHMSPETFDFHHGKHHNTYVTKLNEIIGTHEEYKGLTLEEIIMKSHSLTPPIFNNAAQVWNHTFFWHSMKPDGGGKPTGDLLAKIEEDFGSYEKFVEQFKEAAMTQFGSGWAWLVYMPSEGTLKIVKTANAETPITDGIQPLINCDVWEHAYYIDYRNKRPDYVDSFLQHMVNWDFAEMNLQRVMH